MKRMGIVMLLAVLLTGCRTTPFDRHTIIEWVDFIKWDGIEYNGIYSAVISDENYIENKLGKTKFKVADNVTNPNYKIKDGDAAFHEKGTEVFTIKGYPNFIAVKDSDVINGYRVYFSRDKLEYEWHFKDMPIEKVHLVEIYRSYTPEGTKKITEIKNTR